MDKDYFNFASAHFLIFANGKREALHGHNYQVSVSVEGELDQAGVVLNFVTFTPVVKQVCDELDHRTLIQEQHSLLKIRRGEGMIEVRYKNQRLILPRRDVILLPIRSAWRKPAAREDFSTESSDADGACVLRRLLCQHRRPRIPD
ncbi:MAG: 6-carboxytetrahydropterin synthase [Deltaproteobacteria bacterium]|nr:6-carboxytetrahydropterin synthase [Deltaproteobacteria bacterium]